MTRTPATETHPATLRGEAPHSVATERVYALFVALFAVVLVLTNIVGVKLFVLPDGFLPDALFGPGGLTLTAGIITYPVTFFLTDIVSEIWGRKRANFMVLLGFGMSLLMLGIVLLARVLPPSPLWTLRDLGLESRYLQDAFAATFYLPGVLLFASMVAYLVAQLLDVRLYHFWWRVTSGRHMWLRNNGSTMISQLVDTLIVNGIYLSLGLGLEWSAILVIIRNNYLCKLVLALFDTPFLYLGRGWLRRRFSLADAPADVAPLA